jgi:hypothetical protein
MGGRLGHAWVAFRFNAWHRSMASPQQPAAEADTLFLERLGASGTGGLAALQDYAMLYGGRARAVRRAGHTRLALLLHEAAPPRRAWRLPVFRFRFP